MTTGRHPSGGSGTVWSPFYQAHWLLGLRVPWTLEDKVKGDYILRLQEGGPSLRKRMA